MEEETIEKNIEKFSNKNLEELLVLKRSFKDEIKNKEKKHWSYRIQKKVKFDIYSKVRKISIICFTIGFIGLIISAIIFEKFYNPGSQQVKIIPIEYNTILVIIFVISMLIIIIPALLMTSLDDGTRNLWIKLRAVEIVINNKTGIKKRLMMDTNIFGNIAEGKLKIEDLELAKNKGYEFYITHIQVEEISACKDEEKRSKLTTFMAKISPELIDTESFVLGKSRLGYAKLGDGKIWDQLIENTNNPAHHNDYLIAETAMKNDFVLLSDDDRLRNKITSLGYRAINTELFLKTIKI